MAFALVIAYCSSVPGSMLLAFFGLGCFFVPLSGFVLIGATVDWLARLVATACDRQRATCDRTKPHGRRSWRWAITPSAVLIVISVIVFDWPLKVRFHQSKEALQQAAYAVLDGTIPNMGPQTIGLYRVEKIEVLRIDGVPQAVKFITGWSFDPLGFAYRPNDPWPNSPDRLERCWYFEQW